MQDKTNVDFNQPITVARYSFQLLQIALGGILLVVVVFGLLYIVSPKNH